MQYVSFNASSARVMDFYRIGEQETHYNNGSLLQLGLSYPYNPFLSPREYFYTSYTLRWMEV